MNAQPKSSSSLALALAAGLSLLASPLAAQQALKGLGAEAGVSTLGIYIAPKYKFSDQITGRVAMFTGSMSQSQKIEGNTVSGKVDLASSAVMADFHPFAGAFRVSGGLGLNGYDISGTITNPVFNNNTYTASVAANVKQTNNVVPILSVGYAKTFGNGFGVVAEVGAKMGTYTLTASDANIPALLKAQFNADVAKANSDLQKNTITPFVTLGLSYRF
jgi:hypothetical protein